MPSHGKMFDGLLEALPIRFINPQAESVFGYGRDESGLTGRAQP